MREIALVPPEVVILMVSNDRSISLRHGVLILDNTRRIARHVVQTQNTTAIIFSLLAI